MVLVVVVGSVVATFVLLYSNFGLKDALRIRDVIGHIEDKDERTSTLQRFEGSDPKILYGGVFAGIVGDRLWVWGRMGPKSIVTDEYSVYSWIDGCSPGVLTTFEDGKLGKLDRTVYSDVAVWREMAKVGD